MTDKTFFWDDDYLTEYSENVKVIQLCTCNFIRATGIIDFQPCLSHRRRRIENDNSEGTILSTDIKIRVFYRDCHGWNVFEVLINANPFAWRVGRECFFSPSKPRIDQLRIDVINRSHSINWETGLIVGIIIPTAVKWLSNIICFSDGISRLTPWLPIS